MTESDTHQRQCTNYSSKGSSTKKWAEASSCGHRPIHNRTDTNLFGWHDERKLQTSTANSESLTLIAALSSSSRFEMPVKRVIFAIQNCWKMNERQDVRNHNPTAFRVDETVTKQFEIVAKQENKPCQRTFV